MYLMKYGYMDTPIQHDKAAPLLSRDGLRDYILEFQAFAGLPQTGDLDEMTVELMNTPRCGVKDVVGGSGRKKRYALQGKMLNILQFILKYTRIEGSIQALYKHFFWGGGLRQNMV